MSNADVGISCSVGPGNTGGARGVGCRTTGSCLSGDAALGTAGCVRSAWLELVLFVELVPAVTPLVGWTGGGTQIIGGGGKVAGNTGVVDTGNVGTGGTAVGGGGTTAGVGVGTTTVGRGMLNHCHGHDREEHRLCHGKLWNLVLFRLHDR